MTSENYRGKEMRYQEKKSPPNLQSEPAVGQLNSTVYRCSQENTHSQFN